MEAPLRARLRGVALYEATERGRESEEEETFVQEGADGRGESQEERRDAKGGDQKQRRATPQAGCDWRETEIPVRIPWKGR